MRAVELLSSGHRLLSSLAVLALVCCFVAILGLLVSHFLPAIVPTTERVMLVLASILFAGFVAGVVSALGASVVVLARRSEVVDWGLFLAVIWLVPYLGIALWLGGFHLRRSFARRSRAG